MIELETITRKWGNSMGVILPTKVVQQENIKENEKIHLLIMKRPQTPKGTFGMLPRKFSKSAQQIKDELRKALYND